MSRQDGGPAFPALDFIVPQDLHDQGVRRLGEVRGMSLRDYLAAKALPSVASEFWRGVAAGHYTVTEDWRDGIATDAYALADAMIRAREAGK